MKKILFVVIMCFCLFLFGCSEAKQKEAFVQEYSYYYDSNNVKENWEWFDLDYYKTSLELKRVIKLDFEDVKEKIENDETFVIYYGFNPELYQCPYCVATLPIAINAFNEIDCDIYYLDIYAMRASNTEEYQYLYNQLAADGVFGEKILAPTYVSYREGEVYKYQIATFKNEEGRWITDLNTEQKEQLKEKYQNLLK